MSLSEATPRRRLRRCVCGHLCQSHVEHSLSGAFVRDQCRRCLCEIYDEMSDLPEHTTWVMDAGGTAFAECQTCGWKSELFVSAFGRAGDAANAAGLRHTAGAGRADETGEV